MAEDNTSRGLHTDITFLQQTNSTGFNKYVTIEKNVSKDIKQKDGSLVTEELKHEVYAYNLETNNSSKLKLPKDIQFGPSSFGQFYGNSNVNFVQFDDKGNIKVIVFDVKKQSVIHHFIVPPDKKGGSKVIDMTDSRFYLLQSDPDWQLTITDLKHGKILFKGKVTTKIAENEDETKNLTADRLSIQQ